MVTLTISKTTEKEKQKKNKTSSSSTPVNCCRSAIITRQLLMVRQWERTREEFIHFKACQTILPACVTMHILLRLPAVCVHSAFHFQVLPSPVLLKSPLHSTPNFRVQKTVVGRRGGEHISLCCGFLPTGSSSLADGSTPDPFFFFLFPPFFFFSSDAKHDLQAWVIIYHYSFSVTSALKVNRNASMLTDLLSKIFVPRFRSDDWCLSELQVYALWKASWLDLEPLALALYITLVEWPSETQDTLDVFNTCFLLPYCWHCMHSSWTYVM